MHRLGLKEDRLRKEEKHGDCQLQEILQQVVRGCQRLLNVARIWGVNPTVSGVNPTVSGVNPTVRTWTFCALALRGSVLTPKYVTADLGENCNSADKNAITNLLEPPLARAVVAL